MKRLVVLLLGIVCMCMLAGCGKSDKIEGTWVPQMKSDKVAITSIQFTKQNDFSYQGIVTYNDGLQITSTYNYIKDVNAVGEDERDVDKKDKEHNICGAVVMFFNKNYTEAHLGRSAKPEYIFIKQ